MKRTPLKRKTPLRPVSNKRRAYRASKEGQEARPLRENAKGQQCTLRLSKCRHDPAYTVFAHYRRFGWAGMAQKPNDLLGCFACDMCHDMQEKRHEEATDTELLRAMGETLMVQLQSGILEVSNGRMD